MKIKTIEPIKKIYGDISLPGDKSISHRAVMLGAISKGRTSARGLLDCDDCNYTIRAFRDMGVNITKEGDVTLVEGVGLRGLKRPASPIRVGNSGTSMRILAGILAGQDFKSVLEGDQSLSKRPMRRIVEPLSLMGADIEAASGDFPPIRIRGGDLKPIDYRMPVSSAQVKSAILFAGLYASGVTVVEESVKSRDHTERMMKYFGADIKVNGLKVSLAGGRELDGKAVEIPGDISSASFFIAGAVLLKDSKVTIKKVSINPTRSGILGVLSRMGARVKVLNKVDAFEPYGDIKAESGPLKGIVIDSAQIPGIIDELPIIFVLASLAKGRTVIKGAGELRFKETDRIISMKESLENMGGSVIVEKDEIVIDGVSQLDGAGLKSFGDHRTCMAMTIASLTAKGESSIDDVECVNKSFPGFFEILEGLKK